MKIIKRSGEEAVFDITKITGAIMKANREVESDHRLSVEQVQRIAAKVEKDCESAIRAMNVEEIQDLVEEGIMEEGAFQVARLYITYRYKRQLVRQSNTTDGQIMTIIESQNEEAKQENSNKNPLLASTQRDYMAGEVSKDITKRVLLAPEVWDAHEKGLIHFHDADYFAQHIHNCCLVNLDDMLQNGTVISDTKIDKPNSFSVACTVASQIIAQVASSQYGGQSISAYHLSKFVKNSREKFTKEVKREFEKSGIEASDEQIKEVAEDRVLKDIEKGVQTIQYQVVTLMTTNGQAPFITVFMYLDEAEEGQDREDLALVIRAILNQRILGVKNEQGVYITPAFPKLIYVLDEDNIYEDSKYYDITELAAKCTAKRMVPDYISAKVMKELKQGNVYTCMGCRSFLTPDRFTAAGAGNIANAQNYEEGKQKYYGRFNQGVVTINLVDIACTSNGDVEEFWKVFDDRLELCYKGLMARHNRLMGTKADIAPILWQHGALARLGKGETIDKLLVGGYSTISLGYAGLYECVKYMTGKSHTDESAKQFALDVMQHLNDACAKWKEKENIDFSVYGTPLESTTYKFAKCLQKRFGIIPGVTDKNYITNSYHIHVTEEVDAFTKLSFESQFQKLSPGGAISYVEVPDMKDNIPAVLAVMRHIYDNIMYAELNTKSDYCSECGYDGEISVITDDDGKLIWECPNCGNRNQQTMSVARRTCGYIGTQFWNQGRTQEIKERVLHL
ncbi:MAG: anaerobic ribonucleoside-triphosphate reductase [Lachnospiraceae bacterium]|nr:anaerobic ribonucleoside-triphosphate reductase [Lachnospiraceae bacterium]